MESKDRFAEIIVTYITGEATDNERMAVLSWLKESEANKRLFDELKDVYEVSGSLKKFDIDTHKSWEKVKAKYYQHKLDSEPFIKKKSYRPWLNKFARVAAVFAFAFFLGALCYHSINVHHETSEPLVYNEVIAPLGSKTALVLADGTKVWLNAGSKLKYPVDFSKASRDVYLEGEAYFNVTKMKHTKFVVHTSHLNIRVLGTEFNVKAYPEEKTIQTTLIRGSVTIQRVGKDGDDTPVYLKPNQQATFVKANSNIAVTSKDTDKKSAGKPVAKSADEVEQMVINPSVTTELYTSWKDSRWLIQGEELERLAVELERKYDVKISFKDESLKKYKFSGILKDETFEQVLNIMKLIAPIDYSIRGKQVIFSENKRYKKTFDDDLINTR
ncbi:MAG TPA: FecR family protein [Bacteroidales bacterium]